MLGVERRAAIAWPQLRWAEPEVCGAGRYVGGPGAGVAAGGAPAGGAGSRRIRSVQVSEKHSAVRGAARRHVRRSPPQR